MGFNLPNRDRPRPMVAMVARFALVGIIATAVHAAILALGVEGFAMSPPIATALGFLGGVGVSYTGHYILRFDHRNRIVSHCPHSQSQPAAGRC